MEMWILSETENYYILAPKSYYTGRITDARKIHRIAKDLHTIEEIYECAVNNWGFDRNLLAIDRRNSK